MERKRVLFVINTLGQGGAESALIQFIKKFDPDRYELFLDVILGQGELIRQVPPYVKLLNKDYDSSDVLSEKGKRTLRRHVLKLLLSRGALLRDIPFLWKNSRISQ